MGVPSYELNSDQPITTKEEDLLGRGPLVDQLATWVESSLRRQGLVIGLTGAWGLGKTSVLNLLETKFAKGVRVVRFEPWLFSSADELVVRYFDEISAQLATVKKKRVKRVAKQLARCGDAISPAASLAVGPAGGLLSVPYSLSQAERESAIQQRDELKKLLRQENQPIVVLVDDLDRLTPAEVREVFRLVKLVGDLPGIVHVLAYDRRRIEAALNEAQIEDGTSFLEKIVQVSMAVSPIAPSTCVDISMRWLDEELDESKLVAWSDNDWFELLDRGIGGYLTTLRAGRRFANSAPSALELCGNDVASMDVLALEALRVFDPEVREIAERS